MTIPKAIKVIEREVRYTYRRADQNIPNAFKLSIQALKQWKSSRDLSGIFNFPLLEGETEE